MRTFQKYCDHAHFAESIRGMSYWEGDLLSPIEQLKAEVDRHVVPMTKRGIRKK